MRLIIYQNLILTFRRAVHLIVVEFFFVFFHAPTECHALVLLAFLIAIEPYL